MCKQEKIRHAAPILASCMRDPGLKAFGTSPDFMLADGLMPDIRRSMKEPIQFRDSNEGKRRFSMAVFNDEYTGEPKDFLNGFVDYLEKLHKERREALRAELSLQAGSPIKALLGGESTTSPKGEVC